MHHEDFKEDLRKFRLKSRTWAGERSKRDMYSRLKKLWGAPPAWTDQPQASPHQQWFLPFFFRVVRRNLGFYVRKVIYAKLKRDGCEINRSGICWGAVSTVFVIFINHLDLLLFYLFYFVDINGTNHCQIAIIQLNHTAKFVFQSPHWMFVLFYICFVLLCLST